MTETGRFNSRIAVSGDQLMAAMIRLSCIPFVRLREHRQSSEGGS